MRYWIRFKEQSLGPYSAEEIRRQSALTLDTLVCPEGSRDPADWRRLRDVPELVLALQGVIDPKPSPAPAPPARDRKDLAKLIIKALGGKIRGR